MTIRFHEQAATAVAVSWELFEGDDFDVKRILLTFDVAPTTNENVTITLNSGQGSAYDTVLRSADPAGATSLVFENIEGLGNGDKLLIEYTNTDTKTITGLAAVKV